MVTMLGKWWETFAKIGISSSMEGDEVSRIRALNLAVVFSLVPCFLVLIPFYFMDNMVLVYGDSACIVLGLAFLVFNHFGKRHWIQDIALTGVAISLMIASFYIRPMPSYSIIIAALFVLVNYIIVGRIKKMIYYFVLSAAIILIIISPLFGPANLHYPFFNNVLVSLIGLGLLIFFSFVFDLEFEKRQNMVTDLLEQLTIKNEELEQKVKERTIRLLDSNEELKRTNEELEQFAYAASHDLQEPLRIIGNFVQLLDRKYSTQLGAEGKELIDFTVDAAKRMSRLINEILLFSRVNKEALKPIKIKTEKLINNKMMDMFFVIEERNAKIIKRHLPEYIYGDPTQVGIVVFNLIQNGIKYNESDKPEIIVEGKKEGSVHILTVQDNGIGIPKPYREKVFEMFKRLHGINEYPGTGIGLAFCKKIIERHGGKIWIEDHDGEGTRISFSLPQKTQVRLAQTVS
ncbi:MAG: ATP-binding protein [Bacteroidota bacterium]